jgi:hypothetical protein
MIAVSSTNHGAAKSMQRVALAFAASRYFTTPLITSVGCGRAKRDITLTPPAPWVIVESAERRDVPLMVELTARTEAAAVVEIRSNVEGRSGMLCGGNPDRRSVGSGRGPV